MMPSTAGSAFALNRMKVSMPSRTRSGRRRQRRGADEGEASFAATSRPQTLQTFALTAIP
jgi:hypothetical protein